MGKWLHRDLAWALAGALAIGCAASSGKDRRDSDDDSSSSGNAGGGGNSAGGNAPTNSGSGGGPMLATGTGGTGGACSVAAEQQSDATCSVPVSVDDFAVSSSACWVDSPLALGDPGELTFACGDGPAELAFPTATFVGQSSNCVLDLTLKTQFQFTDGCTWETTQTIKGPLDGELAYSYEEAPIIGTPCASPCTVSAVLALETTGEVVVEPPN